MKRTVLILGAGASYDYGFPLWSELRQQMIDIDLDQLAEEVKLSAEEKAKHEDVHVEFLNFLKKNPELTLDQIVYKIDQPKHKHQNPTGHYLISMAGYILAKCECKKTDGLWVTEMQSILIEYLVQMSQQSSPETNHLANLSIVTLNYDRVFEHFISFEFYLKLLANSRYKPKDLGTSITFALKNQLPVYKPHGGYSRYQDSELSNKIGMKQNLHLDNENINGIRGGSATYSRYADNLFRNLIYENIGRGMYVVDERGVTDYQNANGLINRAEIVLCLGLSDAGLTQSFFNFKQGQKVYLSNAEQDIEKIKASKPEPDYECLHPNGEMLYAKDFPAKFKALAF